MTVSFPPNAGSDEGRGVNDENARSSAIKGKETTGKVLGRFASKRQIVKRESGADSVGRKSLASPQLTDRSEARKPLAHLSNATRSLKVSFQAPSTPGAPGVPSISVSTPEDTSVSPPQDEGPGKSSPGSSTSSSASASTSQAASGTMRSTPSSTQSQPSTGGGRSRKRTISSPSPATTAAALPVAAPKARRQVEETVTRAQVDKTIQDLTTKFGVPDKDFTDEIRAQLETTIRDIQETNQGRCFTIGDRHLIFYTSKKGDDSEVKGVKVTQWENKGAAMKAPIAAGSFGGVYAVNENKIMKLANRSEQAKSELLNEAEIGQHLRRLNGGATPDGIQALPRLVEYGTQNGLIVHRYTGDVSDLARKSRENGGELPPKTVVGGYVNIAKGLTFLHRHDIPHRDVKQKNMFTDGHTFVLGDFGDVKINFGDKADWTAGTIQYMAREDYQAILNAQMARDVALGIEIGKKADVFALGLCLYTTIIPVTNMDNWPFAQTPVGCYDKSPNFARELEQIGEKYGEEMAVLIEQMLNKDRDARPSIEECTARLEAILARL